MVMDPKSPIVLFCDYNIIFMKHYRLSTSSMNSAGKFWRSAARHEVQSLTNFAQQSMSNSEMPAAGKNFEN